MGEVLVYGAWWAGCVGGSGFVVGWRGAVLVVEWLCVMRVLFGICWLWWVMVWVESVDGSLVFGLTSLHRKMSVGVVYLLSKPRALSLSSYSALILEPKISSIVSAGTTHFGQTFLQWP